VERQVASIWAGGAGYLDDVPVEDVSRFEQDFLDQLQRTRPGVLDAIRETGQLSDDTVASLKDAIEEFKRGFETSSGELLVQDEQAEAMHPDQVEQETIKQYQRQPEPQVKREQG
jgi:F-type H+-transporting ATPase subunit alpha